MNNVSIFPDLCLNLPSNSAADVSDFCFDVFLFVLRKAMEPEVLSLLVSLIFISASDSLWALFPPVVFTDLTSVFSCSISVNKVNGLLQSIRADSAHDHAIHIICTIVDNGGNVVL